MRWFAPIVIVALVAAGAARPAHAARPAQRSSMSASTHAAYATAALRESNAATKLAPRRGLAGRGAATDRRSGIDEVFVVPRIVEVVAIPTLSLIVAATPALPCSAAAPVDEVARGPPSLVVSSHPLH